MTAMHAECWAAKVSACMHWAATRTGTEAPNAAIRANRSADASAAKTSQLCIDQRCSQRPWNQNQATSVATPTAQSKPISPLAKPSDARYRE
jgi:hypothetical protein